MSQVPAPQISRPALRTRGAARVLAYHESRNHIRRAVERLDQALAEHDLFVHARTSPRSRAEFQRIVGLAARLGMAVDSWSGA